MDKKTQIEVKKGQIAKLLLKKRDIALFLGRPETTESQLSVFTSNYADCEGQILTLEKEIREIQNQA